MNKYTALMGALCLLTLAPASGSASNKDAPQSADQAAPATVDPSGSPARAPEGPLSRWLDVDALSFTMRYRNSFDTDSVHIFNNIQQRSLVSGKVKFDRDGKYFVGFRAESGRYFNWSFANFSGLDYHEAINSSIAQSSRAHYYSVIGAFIADPQAASILSHTVARGWEFYVRDLYLSATPVKWVTLQFGAIPIERGVSTEITTYDEDGYISGERVIVHAPEHLYLDKILFTSAYVGDAFTPNFFERYDRLTEPNYRQVLGQKHFGSRVKASLDYTWTVGAHTTREAIQVRVPEVRAFDSARVELYQRLNDVLLPGYFAKAANGWAFIGTKHFAKRLTVEGGYATIDQAFGVYSNESTLAAAGFSLNGDSYTVGERFFGRANLEVATGTSLFGFYTHEINANATPLTYSFTRQNFNFGLQLDFKALLQQRHIL